MGAIKLKLAPDGNEAVDWARNVFTTPQSFALPAKECEVEVHPTAPATRERKRIPITPKVEQVKPFWK